MKHSFACPKCGTRFQVDLPDVVRVALCPGCGTPIPVAADEFGSLNMNAREVIHREGNWILWAAGIFALIWGLIVAVMIMVNHRNSPPVAAGTPPPAPVAHAPAPIPVLPSPPRIPAPTPLPPSSLPAIPPAPTPPIAQAPSLEIRVVPKNAALTDAEIVAAIQKGITYLLSNFANGELPENTDSNINMRSGLNALAVYALLHCSQSVHDSRINIGNPAMQLMIDRMKHHFMSTNEDGGPVTYARSLRASALSIYNRPEDQAQLAADLAWLLHAQIGGAFTYDDDYIPPGLTDAEATQFLAHQPSNVHRPSPFYWDNSNSQYGLIGAWSCAEAGLPVPNSFWQQVERHWLDTQLTDGTWSYRDGPPGAYSMTMAGITALSVCRDYMNTDTTHPPTTDPASKANAAALERAIEWLETGSNSVSVSGQNYGYSLYGLERAALASGMMFAGTHDIYRELASQVVPSQLPNGAWGSPSGHDAIIQTSFTLLFLARGRNPVLMNKLRYDGDWANHPRDVANLSRFSSYVMERPVNWQTVTLHQPWQQWLESPILYISGDTPPTFGPADFERLQSYADNGGLIFIHADNGSIPFINFAKDLAEKLFPKYEMVDLPDDDDLFSLQFNIPKPHPHFRVVSNGSRRLMLLCTDDISGTWQVNNSKRDRAAFEFGVNLSLYANGKAELRPKMDSPFIPPPTDLSRKTVAIARLKYAGNWDPEPAAWTRFARYFGWETGWQITPQETPVEDIDFATTPIAYLTGTAPDRPTDQQSAALKKFVEAGGVLFIEPCGGSKLFDQAAKKYWIPAIVPKPHPQPIADTDPILTGKITGMEIAATNLPRILLRPYASQVAKPTNIRLLSIPTGNGRIIFSDLDLTTGLLATNIWGINGYSPEYAQAVLKNAILQSVQQQSHLP